MFGWVGQLDDLLRGRRTKPELMVLGRIDLPLHVFVPVAIVMGAAYGFFMGWYAVFSRPTPAHMQLLASAAKLPALFLLTLIVTFPSLYVFSALAGSRLGLKAMIRLLTGAITVNVAVAASLGPILAFFTISTESYPFMILLNVALLGVAGAVGLGFLLQALRRMAAGLAMPNSGSDAQGPTDENCDQAPAARDVSPLDAFPGRYSWQATQPGKTIFQVWVIIYALVGAQMGWLLRPFIGSPDMPFTWFRIREGNFFHAVLKTLGALLDA